MEKEIAKIIYKLGRRIAKLRKEKHLSQQELADLSGKIINTVSKIEQGTKDVRLTSYLSIALALGEKPGSLLDDAQNAPVIYSPILQKLVDLLQHEDDKILKAVYKQAEVLVSVREKK